MGCIFLGEVRSGSESSSNGCVPVNIFSDDIGQAAAEFIKYPASAGKSVTVNKQNVVMGTLSGNTAGWFSLPGDPGPMPGDMPADMPPPPDDPNDGGEVV